MFCVVIVSFSFSGRVGAKTMEDRRSRIEDRSLKIAPLRIRRFSIFDPQSSILAYLNALCFLMLELGGDFSGLRAKGKPEMRPGWYHHPNFTTRLSPIISAGKAFSGRSFNEWLSARTIAARLNSTPEGIMTSSPTT